MKNVARPQNQSLNTESLGDLVCRHLTAVAVVSSVPLVEERRQVPQPTVG